MKKHSHYTDTEYKFKAKLVEDIIKSTEIYEFFYLRESIFLEDNLRQDVKEELLTLIDKQIDYMRTISHPIEPKGLSSEH